MITSLTIIREANNIWTYQDNTMSVGKPMAASFYDGIIKGDLVYFNTDNGGILYNGIPYSIIEYVDSTDSGNNYTPTSALALIVYLKGQGFFDKSDGGGSGTGTFLGLTDVFGGTYVGRKGQVYVVNDSETGLTPIVNPLDQNNIDVRQRVGIEFTDTVSQIVAKINALPAYSINEKQSLWFICVENTITASPRVLKFKMMNKGKGSYGVGGTMITLNDIELLWDNTATVLDFENDPTTITFNYGVLTGQTVSEWLNEQDPALTIQAQDDGYTLFKGIVDGQEVTYLWTGSPGVYGEGETQSTMSDFQVLSETLPPPYTQKENTAFVDENGSNLTGVLGDPNKPFASPEAACNALPSTGGFVVIGVGSFFSPPKDAIKDNTKFIGAGKPITNSTYSYTSIGVQPTISSPTKLVGGTILLGMFDGSLKDGIELHNLGVDTGLDWCNTYNGGVASDAIRFAQLFGTGLPSADGQHQLQSNSRPRTGIVISNVSALAKSPDSAVHSMLVENCQNPKVSNVSTYYGYYGLVIKAIGANVNGLDAHGHGVDGLILKSNDYAYCQSVSVSNVYITSIVGYDGGGLRFHGAETPLSFCSISNVNIEFTKYGIVDQGTSTGLMLDNITIFNTQGNGVTFSPTTTFSTINNLDQRSGVIGLSINNSGTSNIWHLSNIKCSGNSVEGISLYSPTSNKIYCNNVLAIYNTSEYTKGGNVYGNINDTNVFEKATVLTAPSNPTDVVRLGDLSAATRPYKVYTALIEQTGTSAPTVTVLENTLGGTPTWGYTGAGQYTMTLTGVFTNNKTACFFNPVYSSLGTIQYRAFRWDSDTINVQSYSGGSGANTVINSGSCIEIRVYN